MTSLRVLDAATSLAADIHKLVDRNAAVIEAKQLLASVSSIGANIAEGFGRTGADRAHFLRIARGSTEETIQHLRLNHRAERISSKEFFDLFNRALVIIRMLDVLIRGAAGSQATARAL